MEPIECELMLLFTPSIYSWDITSGIFLRGVEGERVPSEEEKDICSCSAFTGFTGLYMYLCITTEGGVGVLAN